MEEEILEILKSNDYRKLPLVITANEINVRITEFIDWILRHDSSEFDDTDDAYRYFIDHTT